MKRSGLLSGVVFLLALQRVGCGKWARNNGIVGDIPGPAVRACVCDYQCVLGVSARELACSAGMGLLLRLVPDHGVRWRAVGP